MILVIVIIFCIISAKFNIIYFSKPIRRKNTSRSSRKVKRIIHRMKEINDPELKNLLKKSIQVASSSKSTNRSKETRRIMYFV